MGCRKRNGFTRNESTACDARYCLVSPKTQDEIVAVATNFLRPLCVRDDVCAILDEGDLVLIAKVAEALGIGRNAEGVLADDDFCSVADDALDGFRGEVEGILVNVRIDGSSSCGSDGIRDDDAGVALNDYFVTLSNMQGLEEGKERLAAGGEECDVSLEVCRECRTEFVSFFPLLPF